MNFLTDVATFFASKAKRAPQLSDWSIQHEPLDEYAFEDVLRKAGRFRAEVTERPTINTPNGQRTIEDAPHLWQESFHLFHNTRLEPAMHDVEQVKASLRWQHEVLNHLRVDENTAQTRALTRNDPELSALVTLKSKQTLMDLIEQSEDMQEIVDRGEQMGEIEGALGGIDEALVNLRGQAKGEHENGGVSQGTSDQIKELIAQREEARRTLAEIDQQQSEALAGAAVAQAAAQVAEQANGTVEAFTSIPGVGDGDYERMEPHTALALAETWQQMEKLQNVSRLAGRKFRFMSGVKRKKVKGANQRRIGTTVGNDVPRILPSQLALLRKPNLRRAFMLKFAQGQLRQYDVEGIGEETLGPIVMPMDNSGSMGAKAGEYTRDEGAKATALAIMRMAKKEGRDVYLLLVRYNVVHEAHFPAKGPIDLKAVTDFVTQQPGGGTDLTAGIVRAAQIIETHPAFDKADIVLVSDGDDTFDADDIAIKEALAERGVQIHGVAVGTGTTSFFEPICDTVTLMTEVRTDDEMSTHLPAVVF